MRSVLLAVLWLAQAPVSPQDGVPLRVLTFNIRYAEPDDGLDAWPLRRDQVAGLVRFHRPDVAGLQEVLATQLDDLLGRLPGYEAFGEGRDGGRSGEHCTILYRPDRLELLEQDTFWLSDRPDRPGPAWGAKLSRICTWGRFRERASGEALSVWNVHLDHQSQQAREKSAELLSQLIGELSSGEPAVLLGDFNCGEDSSAYARLVGYRPPHAAPLVDALYAAREPGYGPSGTFTGFGQGQVAGQRIDHVFVRGPLRVERHAVLSDTRDGRTPSDHRPVLADLTLGVPSGPTRLELRSGWRFLLDSSLASAGREERDVDDSAWEWILTGEIWERQGHPDADGVGWYRRTVVVPEAWRGSGVHLTWGDVEDRLRLWVNGVEVLSTEGAAGWPWPCALRLPQALLRFGGENAIVFRVEDRGGPGGLASAPVALQRGLERSTHWAQGFREVPLLEDVPWSASAEEQVFSFEVPEVEGEDYLVLSVLDVGRFAEVQVRLVAPDGESTLARRDRFGNLGLELRLERPGRWSVVIDDRRGGEASSRLRVALRDG